MSEPKRLFFDIEATDLSADWGVCLCIGYRLGNGKIEIPTLQDFKPRDLLDDRGLVKYFAEEIYPQADFSIGHYSSRYDIPFINSRLLYHGLPPMPPIFHIDTWRVAKYKMKLSSNRLANIEDFLRVKHQKTKVDKEHWRRAKIGCKKSLKYIVEHCRYDILVLEEVYEKLGHLIKEPVRHMDGCPSCGSAKLQSRGVQRTLTREYHRFHCQKCGGWSRTRTQSSTDLVAA